MGSEVVPTVMDTLTTAVGNVFTLMGNCFTQIVNQPVLVLFLAGTLISVGIGAFARLRRAC